MRRLEIIATTLEDAIAAEAGGAQSVEEFCKKRSKTLPTTPKRQNITPGTPPARMIALIRLKFARFMI